MGVDPRQVTTPDGHRFELRVHSPDQGARQGLFWLPALGVPAQKYDAFAAALGGQGMACAVHEWRGIASSSRRARRGNDWGYHALLAQDIAAGLAALDPQVRWHFGGHSLGGQFAAMAAGLQPARCASLVLLATGVPTATTFRGRQRLGISLFARALPALTRIVGHYPGQRLGFAGREAGGVMRDWAGTVRSGRYAAFGFDEPMDAKLARVDCPVLALRFAHDWLVPAASLDALLAKLGPGSRRTELFDDARLGARADHFRWMRTPQAVAACIAGGLSGASP